MTQPVRVKPLEWEKGEARSIAGLYAVHNFGAFTKCYAPALYNEQGNFEYIGDTATLEEAQVACQADYERRILSALEPVPDDLVKADQWQPIETAPYDEIILCMRHDGNVVQDFVYDGGNAEMKRLFTHWMHVPPLPSPPKETP